MHWVRFSALLIAGWALLASGCAMCSNVDDYTYPTYGGKHERMDRHHGRVGSVLSAGGMLIGEQGMPTTPDVPMESLPTPAPGEPVNTTILD